MADPLIAAASGLVGRLIGDFIKVASQSVANEVAEFSTPAKIKSLSRKLGSFEKIKTIKDPDKPIKISSFYISPSFSENPDTSFPAKTVDDFGNEEHTLIEGIAGQGKSVFMRQLCVEEIKLGRRLPVLIELRKITPGKGLRDFSLEYLRSVGFCRCEEIWKYLLESGFAVFLLDGYDEVPEQCRMQLIHDINMLAMGYDQLRIVLTSRPEPSIKGASCFRTVKMCRLDNSGRNAIIKKICDRSTASRLITKMAKNSSLSEIVDTPLFATLLCIVYRIERRLPEAVHEFYDMVFQTLLYRHDDHKEGYERPRKSGLGNHQFGNIFEHFCFHTSLKQQLRLTRQTATEHIAVALQKEGSDSALADKYFQDVVKITCLLVEDGSEYQFLHKSIQDYFSARYIKRLPEEQAKAFYAKLLEKPSKISQLSQSILFLYEIDSYRAYKYFSLPGLSFSLFESYGKWSDIHDYLWTGSLVLDVLTDAPIVVALKNQQNAFDMHSIHVVTGGKYTLTLRRAMLLHFDLLFLIVAISANLLAKNISPNAEVLASRDPEAIELIGQGIADAQGLWPFMSGQVIQDLDLQEELATLINESEEMNGFRARVKEMTDILLRSESNDFLELI